jgi:hypothetical protein
MAKGKTSGKSDINYWSRYQSNKVWEVNRKRKLAKHIKAHPGDEVAKKAVSNIKYRRKTPKAPFWTSGNIRIAAIFKQVTGKVNPDMFNSNHKIQQEAMGTYSGRSATKVNQPSRVSFSIGARAHDGRGNSTWIG